MTTIGNDTESKNPRIRGCMIPNPPVDAEYRDDENNPGHGYYVIDYGVDNDDGLEIEIERCCTGYGAPSLGGGVWGVNLYMAGGLISTDDMPAIIEAMQNATARAIALNEAGVR